MVKLKYISLSGNGLETHWDKFQRKFTNFLAEMSRWHTNLAFCLCLKYIYN